MPDEARLDSKDEIRNETLDEETRKFSVQLFHMIVMSCAEDSAALER